MEKTTISLHSREWIIAGDLRQWTYATASYRSSRTTIVISTIRMNNLLLHMLVIIDESKRQTDLGKYPAD
jgi:hypothetical protein